MPLYWETYGRAVCVVCLWNKIYNTQQDRLKPFRKLYDVSQPLLWCPTSKKQPFAACTASCEVEFYESTMPKMFAITE